MNRIIELLDELGRVLGKRVVARIAGSVPAMQRQTLVDALTNAPAGSALIAQITAGGVGLNIQSASQVITCEPQVKPTINVHRLSSVMTPLMSLAAKAKVFDVYARLSETAEIPDAERARLGLN